MNMSVRRESIGMSTPCGNGFCNLGERQRHPPRHRRAGNKIETSATAVGLGSPWKNSSVSVKPPHSSYHNYVGHRKVKQCQYCPQMPSPGSSMLQAEPALACPYR